MTDNTELLNRDWLASCFVRGPHGWCHLDGQIGFVDSVGKRPGVDEVVKDWQTLACTFPFLDVGVTLMSGGESDDLKTPVVSMLVRNGEVALIDPSDKSHDVHAGHPPPTRGNGLPESLEQCIRVVVGQSRRRPDGRESLENAIPWEWIEEWAQRFNPKNGAER